MHLLSVLLYKQQLEQMKSSFVYKVKPSARPLRPNLNLLKINNLVQDRLIEYLAWLVWQLWKPTYGDRSFSISKLLFASYRILLFIVELHFTVESCVTQLSKILSFVSKVMCANPRPVARTQTCLLGMETFWTNSSAKRRCREKRHHSLCHKRNVLTRSDGSCCRGT